MKKLVLFLFAVALTVGVSARSIIIPVSQLPVAAQNFLSENFALSSIRYVEQDRNEYEVKLYNGIEIEFKRSGELKSIEADRGSLPASVLNALPASIKAQINSRFADWRIVEIEIKNSTIEIELEKGRYEAELKFNKSGQLLKVKYDD